MQKRITNNLVGRKIGFLTVLGDFRRGRERMLKCRCVCGRTHVAMKHNVVSGNTKSCGCMTAVIVSRARTVHGNARKTPERCAWANAKDRCSNPHYRDYGSYGGRGIKMCRSWLRSFDCFLKEMGAKPSPRHRLARKNVNRGYTPANTIWATVDTMRQHRFGGKIG